MLNMGLYFLFFLVYGEIVCMLFMVNIVLSYVCKDDLLEERII